MRVPFWGACFLTVLSATGAVRGAEASPIALEAAGPEQACLLEGRRPDQPLPVLVDLDPESLARPTFLDPLIDCAPSRHLEIVVRLIPPTAWQIAPDPYEAVSEWLESADRSLRTRHAAIGAVELGLRPDLVLDPDAYVFLVEKVSTLLRSLDPDAVLVLGALGESSGPWLDRIEPVRLTPYIRGLALEDPVALETWMPRLRRDYPGMPVWLHSDPAQMDAAAALRRLHAARAAGVEASFENAQEDTPALRAVVNLYRALPPRFVAADPVASGPSATRVLSFVDPLGPERSALLIDSREIPLAAAPEAVRNVRAFALETGDSIAAQVQPDPSDPDGSLLSIGSLPGPAIVRYVVASGPHPEPEAVQITADRELTAEEIIAGERAFTAAQTRLMNHYEARASIAYHYRAETLQETIDVASTNRFYWTAGTGEYEETDLYVNGARWHGKPPSLPFIQAEKVKEVPLAIRLDQSYVYRLAGTETVRGQPVYVIAFEPAEKDSTLYSGEVWIDRRTFARVKIRLVQHGLKPPITSNMDVIEYEPIAGPTPEDAAEHEFWLPVRGYRQMVFTVLGREVAAERTALYENFSINAPSFERRREAAIASGAPILREDAIGPSYLVGEGGTVTSRKVESLKNVAFFGGAGANGDGSLGTPFAGLNYFDFDWMGTGTQINLAFAGPLADVAWTNPGLGASRWELTLEGRFVGIPERFRGTSSDGAVEEEDVGLLRQMGLVVLSHPLPAFQKAVLRLETDSDRYSRESRTDGDFVLPASGITGTATAGWSLQRGGYGLDVWFSHGHRFNWEDWGIAEADASARGIAAAHGSGDDTEFDQWGTTFLKSFYPGRLQNLALGISLFDGSGLDRFSRFRIGDFQNARVRGFSSKDITFDRGVTGLCSYRFTLPGGRASMEFGIEGSVIENADDFLGREHLLGGGAALTINGPWSTLLSFRTHFALDTSLDTSLGTPSLRVVIIKTLDHWPHLHGDPKVPSTTDHAGEPG